MIELKTIFQSMNEEKVSPSLIRLLFDLKPEINSGLYDLLELWHVETESFEKKEILKDIQNTVNDICLGKIRLLNLGKDLS